MCEVLHMAVSIKLGCVLLDFVLLYIKTLAMTLTYESQLVLCGCCLSVWTKHNIGMF